MNSYVIKMYTTISNMLKLNKFYPIKFFRSFEKWETVDLNLQRHYTRNSNTSLLGKQ